ARERPPLGFPGARGHRSGGERQADRRRDVAGWREALSASAESPIGVFDSGVGGLTVVREVWRQLPDEAVVYFGDTARVPYGPKSRETVQRYAREAVAYLLSLGVKLTVVACNT